MSIRRILTTTTVHFHRFLSRALLHLRLVMLTKQTPITTSSKKNANFGDSTRSPYFFFSQPLTVGLNIPRRVVLNLLNESRSSQSNLYHPIKYVSWGIFKMIHPHPARQWSTRRDSSPRAATRARPKTFTSLLISSQHPAVSLQLHCGSVRRWDRGYFIISDGSASGQLAAARRPLRGGVEVQSGR